MRPAVWRQMEKLVHEAGWEVFFDLSGGKVQRVYLRKLGPS